MGNAGYNPFVSYYCQESVTWDCPSVAANDVDYDCHFGGTSAAAPVVAGTASLVLAMDPTLTAQEVYNILANSAVTNLDWGTLPYTPHPEYGHGRVDAFRAVLSISHGNIDNDSSGVIDVGDLSYLISYLYQQGPAPFPSLDLANWDCDNSGGVDIADLTGLIAYLY
jgi:subtilisin family serine protease